jgi:hypothetical protein
MYTTSIGDTAKKGATIMATVMKVKVWQAQRWETINGKATRECRVYVAMDDGREGCKYLTGNAYQKAGTITGDLTKEEWNAARAVGVLEGKWRSYYATPLPTKAVTTARAWRCPDCGVVGGSTRGCGAGACGA